MSTAPSSSSLGARKLGTADLVFFVVAASAPLTAVAGGQAATFLVTGNAAIPLLYLPLAAILGLFAVGYAAMSRYVTDAGAFYAYVARGLGGVPAVAVAFLALLSYAAIQLGVYGLFGVAFGAFIDAKLGLSLDWYWWCLVAWGLVAALGLLQIDLSAKVLAVLLVLEVLVVVMFDLAVVADPGPEGLSMTSFSPSVATGGALGAALVFSVASFVGFESAAIYSEEAKDPQRTVARATLIAIASIGVFYAVSGWLLANAVGPSTMTDPAALVAGGFTDVSGTAPDPTTVLIGAGTARLGALWGDSAALLFATSLFAALLAFQNAVARYVFALGREGVFPAIMARTSSRTAAPIAGSMAQSVVGLVVVGGFAVAGRDPVLNLFTWMGAVGALGVLAMMVVTSLAVVTFFRRQPTDLGRWRTRVAPAVAGLLLAAILVLGVGNFNVLVVGAVGAPMSDVTVGLLVLVAGAATLGALVGLRLRARRPDVYARLGSPDGELVAPRIVEPAAAVPGALAEKAPA